MNYESEAFASVMLKKNKPYWLNFDKNAHILTFPELILLHVLSTIRTNSPLKVLDFGGMLGGHYFLAKSYLQHSFDWTVVETESIAKAGSEMGAPELKFIQDLGLVRDQSYDLIFTSSALQYTSSPIENLKRLTELNSPHFLLTRSQWLNSATENKYFLQVSRLKDNGPGALPPGVVDHEISYPLVLAPKDQYLDVLKNRYGHQMQFRDQSGESLARSFGSSGGAIWSWH